MKKRVGLGAVSGLMVGALALAPGVSAQPTAQDDPAELDPAAPVEQPEEEPPSKFKIGLYVSFGYGLASTDGVDTSVISDDVHVALNEFTLDEQTQGVATIGWKLPSGHGDFRLVFEGFREDSYEFNSVGGVRSFAPGVDLNPACSEAGLAGVPVGSSPGFFLSPDTQRCLYGIWGVNIKDGRLSSVRTPAVWDPQMDDNPGNPGGAGRADPNELRFLPADYVFQRPVVDELQNQYQTVDALYGREFGGRRYSSRWFAGLRYFKYEGQVLAGAWLDLQPAQVGYGFTDGNVVRLLDLAQDTSGLGPTGSWEVDFNFFDRGLSLYLRGQTAFTFNSLEVDSGNFFTLVSLGGSNSQVTRLVPVRLQEQRDKSSWQNTAEAGARLRFRNGLDFSVAYRLTGYLDVVMLPSAITIPRNEAQAAAGATALYGTRDLRTDGFFATVGFQF